MAKEVGTWRSLATWPSLPRGLALEASSRLRPSASQVSRLTPWEARHGLLVESW